MKGVGAANAIGASALILTGVTAIALAWPNSAPARWLNLAPVYEARANALLASPNLTIADLALAERETLHSLRQAPANPTAWLRLAYIDSLRPEGLGPVGLVALGRSYEEAPYGPDDTAWRLRFAFNHWSRLDVETRRKVLDELAVATPVNRKATHDLEKDIHDPAGRLAVSLMVNEAERQKRAPENFARQD